MRKSMTVEHRLVLKKNYIQLVNEMQVEYMLPYFIQEGVLFDDMAAEIRACSTSFAMNDKLLQLLPLRGDRAFYTLLQALKFGSGQLHLMDLLNSTTVTREDIEQADRVRVRPESCSSIATEESSVFDESPPTKLPTQISISKPMKGTTSQRGRLKSHKVIPHKEQLQGVAYLFPYIIAHVHKKWRQLGVELGLTDEDLSHIQELPHEKLSRCAHMVLNTWLSKDKARATKTVLMQALQKLSIRKALDAISIYNVPKYKSKSTRKQSVNNENVFKKLYDDTESSKPPSHNGRTYRKTGALPIKVDVAQIVQNEDTLDITQRAFLEIANKITDSMVSKGEEATHVLNNLERLHGIVFHGLKKGSILIETQVLHLLALEKLWRLFHSGELLQILEDALVTSELLDLYKVSEIRFTAEIKEEDYELCKADLLSFTHVRPSSDEMSSAGNQSDQTDISDSSDFEEADQDVFPDETDTIILRDLLAFVQQSHKYLRETMAGFDLHISEFLMTLQLVVPPEVTKIHTLDELRVYRQLVQQNPRVHLSLAALDAFFNLHNQFCKHIQMISTKLLTAGITDVTRQIANTASDSQGEGRDRFTTHAKVFSACNTLMRSTVQHCQEKVAATQRMLTGSYDFSASRHRMTVQMTTLETLGYRGLLSFFLIILDVLTDVETLLANLLSNGQVTSMDIT